MRLRSAEPTEGFEAQINDEERRFVQLLTRPAVRVADDDVWTKEVRVVVARARLSVRFAAGSGA